MVHVVGARMSLIRMQEGLNSPPVSVQPKAITCPVHETRIELTAAGAPERAVAGADVTLDHLKMPCPRGLA